MTDQELLEAAAKAAGLTTHTYCAPWGGMAQYNGHLDEFYGPTWNPLADDGDALRLAVKLRLIVDPWSETACTVRHRPGGSRRAKELSTCGTLDSGRATRRAIVRAAAELSK